jgi:hypothetical protein
VFGATIAHCADFLVCLVDSKLQYFWSLFGLRLYFCLVCVSFIGFDNGRSESICWVCETELEEDDKVFEVLDSIA